MGRDPATVDAELVARVRAHTEGAGDAEIRAALAPLSASEERNLQRLLSDSPRPFSPAAWADLARGVSVEVASARELSGYYTLLAERNALAAMVGQSPKPRPEPIPDPGRQRQPQPQPVPSTLPGEGKGARANHLLGLFAYHRDAPLVARALGVSLSDLNSELDDLKIRRKAYRLVRGIDADLPRAAAVKAPSGPPVRRRAKSAAVPSPEVPPPPSPSDDEQTLLKSVLADVGPRRATLSARLGTSGAALLARFRSAGLERELALRERDLIRALWSKHHASEAKVAAELGIDERALREIAVERGLMRELDAVRDRLRRDARRRKWPRDRIEQVLHDRDTLRGLGVYDELLREVNARAGVVWKSLSGKRDALDLFAKKLRLSREEAIRLQKLLDLR